MRSKASNPQKSHASHEKSRSTIERMSKLGKVLDHKSLIATLQHENKHFAGYQEILKRYGNNPEYIEFFSKLKMQKSADGRVSFILGNRKYSFILYAARTQPNFKMLSDDDTISFVNQFPWSLVNGEHRSYLTEKFKWQEFGSLEELEEENRKSFKYNRMDLGNKILSLVEILELWYPGILDNKTQGQRQEWERWSMYIAEGMGGHYMEEIWWKKPAADQKSFPRAWISQVSEEPMTQYALVYEEI